MKLVTLEYEPYFALALPDGRLREETYRIKHFAADRNCNVVLQFSTDNIFYLTCLDVARGEIDHRNVVFKFNGQIFPLNKYGQYDGDAPGFLGVAARINELTLREMMRIGPE